MFQKTFANALTKALTTTGDGAELASIPDIDMALHEELLKMQPLAQLLTVLRSEGKTR